MRWVFELHAASTLMMAGLIWFVQLVHYPLFPAVGEGGFIAYERSHQIRTTWIVAPLMAIELITAIAIATTPLGRSVRVLAYVGLALVAVNWLSTALVQVPDHERLARGFDAVPAARLVATNWIRTAAWTIRGSIALLMLRSTSSEI
ncbi:MAG: hypothetical protein SF069_08285 [Phycisphaerae bacterium]|nr:hypothetical protein [Phycisphaerae bacterium]